MASIIRQLGAAAVFCAALVTCVVLLAGSAPERFTAAAAIESSTQSQQPGERVRIGTYDSRAIAVAYAASDLSRQRIDGWMDELKQAESANDTKRVAEIKARGEAAQRRLHRQGFSTEPIDDILTLVRDRLPDVAHQTDVVAITRFVDHHDPAAAELVDVTAKLVQLFNPSPKTLRTIEELRKQDPVDLDVIAKKNGRD